MKLNLNNINILQNEIESEIQTGSSATEKRRRKRKRNQQARRKEALARFPFVKEIDVPEQVESALLTNLNSIVKGNDQELITPFGTFNNPESLLKDWDEIYSSNISKINDSLKEIEQSNRDKYGSRSVQKPWKERFEGVDAYFNCESIPQNLVDQIVNEANASELKQFRPASLDKVAKVIKKNTSAGLPYMTSKGKVINECMSNLEEQLERHDPCVLFTRTQEGGKTRAVWGFPIAWTIYEQQYYRPILKYQQNLSWRSAIVSPEATDKAVTEMINKALATGYQILSIDFSSYDASVGPQLQDACFDYLKRKFQEDVHSHLDRIAYNFKTIGLVTPDGIKEGEHGVPSGSTFTNEVDSIAQYLVAKASSMVDISNIQIQGDDGLYLVKDPDKLMDFFKSFGLNVNESKSMTSQSECVYLQKLYSPDYRLENGTIGGVYSTFRALLRLVYQERFTDLKDVSIDKESYYAIRAICILENCKYHPLFEELVHFVASREEVNLKVDEKSMKQYIEYLKEKDGRFGVITNQYGDEIKGLKSFETVRLLSS